MKLQIASRIHPKDQISLKHIMFPKATTVKILSKVVVHAKKATFLGTLSPRHFFKESGDYSTPQSFNNKTELQTFRPLQVSTLLELPLIYEGDKIYQIQKIIQTPIPNPEVTK
jgi:hypothetical protein